jgi:hypothetical protein
MILAAAKFHLKPFSAKTAVAACRIRRFWFSPRGPLFTFFFASLSFSRVKGGWIPQESRGRGKVQNSNWMNLTQKKIFVKRNLAAPKKILVPLI